jgi:ABC-type protease/lipase transport system fused ATPase/permease subunit
MIMTAHGLGTGMMMVMPAACEEQEHRLFVLYAIFMLHPIVTMMLLVVVVVVVVVWVLLCRTIAETEADSTLEMLDETSSYQIINEKK